VVIDTSALIAILSNEPDARRLLLAIEHDRHRLVSAAAVVEATLVLLGRYGESAEPELDRLLRTIGAEVIPVGDDQVTLARDAALRFGRGRHPAALNFGDCFSYALSIARGEPLLFVGNDFSQTDVEVCRY
jgi:ribonuclease VapC